MAKVNMMYAIGTAAGVLLVGAAVITAYGTSDGAEPARVGVTTLGEKPLDYARPTFLDQKPKVAGEQPMAAADQPKVDQLVALRQRRPIDLSSWSVEPIGDGKGGSEFSSIDPSATTNPHSPPSCLAITYASGPTGWAGGYWLSTKGNWGTSPGMDLRGYEALTFYARGALGGERVEFKVGGIDASARPGIQYKDSLMSSLGTLTLSKDWRRYSIALDGLDASSVLGGFAWVATLADNPTGVTFYLDDMRYE